MNNLYVQITQIDRDSSSIILNSNEAFKTKFENSRELYRELMSEYGKCIGKLYIDAEGKSKHIGWCFIKRESYDDCDKTFLCETVITVLSGQPEVVVKKSYE